MPVTNFSPLLGLALPTTGDLSGTWGVTVNDSITSLLDSAISGTTSITTDSDITLTTTNGVADQSRQAVILWNPASGTTTRTITAPAKSKLYTVINASGGTQSIVFRATGQTGVTIVKGESALLAFNGTDFIKVSNTAGSGTFTNVTVTGNLTVNSLTNTRVPYASTSGLLVDSANMTFNGTRLTVADLADSGLTATRVVYSTTGGALVDSANLTFDGTNLGLGGTTNSYGSQTTFTLSGSNVSRIDFRSNNVFTGTILSYQTIGEGLRLQTEASLPIVFSPNNTEAMRLTSTGLGIGTSSPGAKLQVNSGDIRIVQTNNSANNGLYFRNAADSSTFAKIAYVAATGDLQVGTTQAYSLLLQTNDTTRATLDSSGNLGLAVTPSAWTTFGSIFQGIGYALAGFSSGSNVQSALFCNSFFNGSNHIYRTTAAASEYLQISGQHQWFTAPSGTAGNAITFTQAMTLDASGNLGIGTSSPNARLAVAGGGIRVSGYSSNSSGDGVNIQLGVTGGVNYLQSLNGTGTNNLSIDANQVTFRTGSFATAATIDSSGNLLVGKTTSSDTVVGLNFYAGGFATATQSSSTNANTSWATYSTGAGAYRFYVGMGGTIFATSTTISAISDQRLKENIQDLDVGLNAVMALKPRKFDWKAGKGKDIKGDRGWIAQEFEQVFPDMIDTWKDEAPEGEEPYKSVRADLIPVLVKAIQELKAEFDAYKASHP